MERKQYLELCQKHAVGLQVMVVYREHQYYPFKYELGFDKNGQTIHTAILKAVRANSLTYCRLEDVKEDLK